MVYRSGQIFLPFCHSTRVWQTDRRTDRRTEFSSLDRVCIACSAVKSDNCDALHLDVELLVLLFNYEARAPAHQISTQMRMSYWWFSKFLLKAIFRQSVRGDRCFGQICTARGQKLWGSGKSFDTRH